MRKSSATKRGFTYDPDAVRDAETGVLREEVETLESAVEEPKEGDGGLDWEEVTSVGGLAHDLGLPIAPDPGQPELPAEETAQPESKIEKLAGPSKQHTKLYRELKERDPAHKRTCSICLRRVPLNRIKNEVCDDCDQ